MTWRGIVGPDGNFPKPRLRRRGQVYVYNQSGTLIDTIEAPVRRTQVMFGGPDGRTLFIAARTSLYSVRPRP